MRDRTRLRHVADVNPSTPAFDHLSDDAEVVFLPLEAVWADSRVDFTRRRPKCEVTSGYVRFQSADVLCPKVTPTFQAGRSAVVPLLPLGVGAASTEVHVVRARAGVSDPRFIRYNLLAKSFIDEGVSRFQGVAGLQRVPDEFLRDFRLLHLAIEQEGRIADFLDDQVARIENIFLSRQLQIRGLRQLISIELDRLFSISSLATEPGVRLGRFIVGIEQGWSPQCEATPAAADEWGVLKVSAVRDGQFCPDQNKRLPEYLDPQTEYEVRPNDLLVTRANTPALVGSFAVVPEGARSKLILCDKIMRIRVNESIDPRYVALAGRTTGTRASLSGASTGTSQSMVNIRGDDVRDLRIPHRNLEDQRRMVDTAQSLMGETGRASELLSMQLIRLRELQRSLITAAVTGEFDVSSADGSRVPA